MNETDKGQMTVWRQMQDAQQRTARALLTFSMPQANQMLAKRGVKLV